MVVAVSVARIFAIGAVVLYHDDLEKEQQEDEIFDWNVRQLNIDGHDGLPRPRYNRRDNLECRVTVDDFYESALRSYEAT